MNSNTNSGDKLPNFSKNGGFITAIAQDYQTRDVLMVAWMNEEAWIETLSTKRAVYFSRSRNKLWRKGEESGHIQRVHELFVDCDGDAVLLKVEQVGAACHEGFRSCFYREWSGNDFEVRGEPLVDPRDVYTGRK